MSSENGVPYDKPLQMLVKVEIERQEDPTIAKIVAKFNLVQSEKDLQDIIQERIKRIADKHGNIVSEEFKRDVEFDLTMFVKGLEDLGIIEIKEHDDEQAH